MQPAAMASSGRRLVSEAGILYLGSKADTTGARQYSDVRLCTGDGARITANRVVCAAGCALFHRSMSRAAEDEEEQAASTVLLPDFSSAEVSALIDLLYGRTDSADLGLVGDLMECVGFRWRADGTSSASSDLLSPKPPLPPVIECKVEIEPRDEEDEEVLQDYYDEDYSDVAYSDDDDAGSDSFEDDSWRPQRNGRRGSRRKGFGGGSNRKRKRASSAVTAVRVTRGRKRSKVKDEVSGGEEDETSDGGGWAGGGDGDGDGDEVESDDDGEVFRDDHQGDDDLKADGGNEEEDDEDLNDQRQKSRVVPGDGSLKPSPDPNEPGHYLCPVSDCLAASVPGDASAVFQHMRDVHGVLVCRHCGFECQRPAAMRSHLFRRHGDRSDVHLCLFCSQLFSSPRDHVEHVRGHMLAFKSDKDGAARCPEADCSYSHLDGEAVWAHLRSTHGKTDCPHCAEYVSMRHHLLSGHSGNDHSANRFCYLCPRGFESADAVHRHVELDHPGRCARMEERNSLLICPSSKSCEYKTKDRLEMLGHCAADHGDIICPVCLNRYRSGAHLRRHLKRAHPGRKYAVCVNCVRIFECRKELASHRKECGGKDEGTMCHMCGDSVAARSFSAHTKRCRGRKGAKKSMNDMMPNPYPNLTKEMFDDSMDDGGRYVCPHDGCDYRSAKRHQTVKHFHRYHNRQTCPHCHREYSFFSILTHIAHDHTGETRHQCDQCPERFFDRSSLRAHVETVHVAQPIHMCEVCGQGFTSRRAQVVHTSEKHNRAPQRHPCPVCGQVVRSKVKLVQHIQANHAEVDAGLAEGLLAKNKPLRQ